MDDKSVMTMRRTQLNFAALLSSNERLDRLHITS